MGENYNFGILLGNFIGKWLKNINKVINFTLIELIFIAIFELLEHFEA